MAQSASGRHLRNLALACAIGVVFMFVEFVVAIATSSLALMRDAAHMLTDVAGLGMALGAILLAKAAHPPTPARSAITGPRCSRR